MVSSNFISEWALYTNFKEIRWTGSKFFQDTISMSTCHPAILVWKWKHYKLIFRSKGKSHAGVSLATRCRTYLVRRKGGIVVQNFESCHLTLVCMYLRICTSALTLTYQQYTERSAKLWIWSRKKQRIINSCLSYKALKN